MQWPLIPKGSVVDIIAPSGKIEPENMLQIDAYVRSLGLIPRIPDNLLGEHAYLSNKDEIRWQHLHDALNAEDSTLIWCVRGGHGVTRIMPELTQLTKPKKQKLLVGFSDITSLHLWLNQAWQWPSLHGPMVRQNANGKNHQLDMAAEEKIFFEGINNYQFGPLMPLNKLAYETEVLAGITAGTCISILQTSLGTPWQIDAQDKIVVLEDINETVYRMDRILVHLSNAGVFDQVKAIVFGDFGESPEIIFDMKLLLDELAHEWLPKRNIHVPIYRVDGFGHGPRNKPLPLGVNAKITRQDNEIFLRF